LLKLLSCAGDGESVREGAIVGKGREADGGLTMSTGKVDSSTSAKGVGAGKGN
jgi:hypothetical protein